MIFFRRFAFLCTGFLTGAFFYPTPTHAFPGQNSLPLILDETFPADDYVRQQALFWVEIYLNTSEEEGWLHDPLYPELVFRKISAKQGKAGRSSIDQALTSLQNELRICIRSNDSLTVEQRQLCAMLPENWDTVAVELCNQRIRFQRGLRERFRLGIERSYRYLPLIDSIFSAEGTPNRLKYLPHVESSFHPYAYSKVGAAGMWQFMKATGKKYLKVDYYVDERRDPIASTRAAAKMLLRNYAIVESWPLAVMAYNHGPGGVARAISATGSRSMDVVLKSYYSNTFGFASRNFYAEFLASSTLAILADSIYADLDKWEPLEFREFILTKPLSTLVVAERSGISLAELEGYNLMLRPSMFKDKVQLPKGFQLRLPVSLDSQSVSTALALNLTTLTEVAKTPSTPKKNPQPDKAEVKPKKVARDPILVASKEPIDKPAILTHAVIDSSFALQLTDWDEVGHPWDQFKPTTYNLWYQYENGWLSVRVGPEETLSHFAEWSGISASSIRSSNRLLRSGDFRLNRTIRFRLTFFAAELFVKKREENFRGIEEDFYTRYHVGSLEPLVIQKGTHVWGVTQEREIPYWLFLKHNPDRALNELRPNDTVMLPVIEEGWRRWGFTRYSNSQEYLRGVRRFLARGDSSRS